jgi:hypothetical protein
MVPAVVCVHCRWLLGSEKWESFDPKATLLKRRHSVRALANTSRIKVVHFIQDENGW